ncbi:hypothetical protein L208DRAFT_1287590 [Tricholoma matsutake]|nr:hypothetical protein L208DRAFT_1287590 [Tricholoma matsutake 945]
MWIVLNFCTPTPALHPHVLAHDRMLLCKTPFSIYSLHHLASFFPLETILCWCDVISTSIEEQTHENYGTSLLCFTQFCNKYNIHENLQMPSSEALLCLFIANQGASSVSEHTVSSWLSSLEMWHSINGAPWHGG